MAERNLFNNQGDGPLNHSRPELNLFGLPGAQHTSMAALRGVNLFDVTIGPGRTLNFDAAGHPVAEGGVLRASVTNSGALRITNLGTQPIAVVRRGGGRVDIPAGGRADVDANDSIFLPQADTIVRRRLLPPYNIEVNVNGARVQLPVEVGQYTQLGRHLTVADPRISRTGISVCWNPEGGLEIIDTSTSGVYLPNGQRIPRGIPFPLNPRERLFLGRPDLGYEIRLVPRTPLGVLPNAEQAPPSPVRGSWVVHGNQQCMVVGFDPSRGEVLLVPRPTNESEDLARRHNIPPREVSQSLFRQRFTVIFGTQQESLCRDLETGLFYAAENINADTVRLTSDVLGTRGVRPAEIASQAVPPRFADGLLRLAELMDRRAASGQPPPSTSIRENDIVVLANPQNPAGTQPERYFVRGSGRPGEIILAAQDNPSPPRLYIGSPGEHLVRGPNGQWQLPANFTPFNRPNCLEISLPTSDPEVRFFLEQAEGGALVHRVHVARPEGTNPCVFISTHPVVVANASDIRVVQPAEQGRVVYDSARPAEVRPPTNNFAAAPSGVPAFSTGQRVHLTREAGGPATHEIAGFNPSSNRFIVLPREWQSNLPVARTVGLLSDLQPVTISANGAPLQAYRNASTGNYYIRGNGGEILRLPAVEVSRNQVHLACHERVQVQGVTGDRAITGFNATTGNHVVAVAGESLAQPTGDCDMVLITESDGQRRGYTRQRSDGRLFYQDSQGRWTYTGWREVPISEIRASSPTQHPIVPETVENVRITVRPHPAPSGSGGASEMVTVEIAGGGVRLMTPQERDRLAQHVREEIAHRMRQDSIAKLTEDLKKAEGNPERERQIRQDIERVQRMPAHEFVTDVTFVGGQVRVRLGPRAIGAAAAAGGAVVLAAEVIRRLIGNNTVRPSTTTIR